MGNFFGIGAAEDAAGAQIQGQREALAEIRGARDQARADVDRGGVQGSRVRRAGAQAAINAVAGFQPAQAAAMTAGNLGAQMATQQGAQQAANALLGGSVDFSALNPIQVQYDPAMFQAPTLNNILGPNRAMTTPGDQNFYDTPSGYPIAGGGSSVGGNAGEPVVGTGGTGGTGGGVPTDGGSGIPGTGAGGNPGGGGGGAILPPESVLDRFTQPDMSTGTAVPPPFSDPVTVGPGGFVQGGGVTLPPIQQPITQQDQYDIPSNKRVSLYGGEFVLNKGETLRQFEQRMRQEGNNVYLPTFEGIFRNKGAFGG